MFTSTNAPFLVLDGVDGCGKSTQAARLVRHFAERAREGQAAFKEPLHLREPGGTAVGEKLRDVLLSRDLGEVDPAVETLLFCASRAQMLREKVAPALRDGHPVICERFNGSTFAYQAVAGHLDEERVLDLLERWSSRPAPTMTFVLDVDPVAVLERRGEASDRIEDKGVEFQIKVREGFKRWATRVPNVRVVDAVGAPEVVTDRILQELQGIVS
ncbi:MAG: dTMP kinase [Planctomycetota bacterium]